MAVRIRTVCVQFFCIDQFNINVFLVVVVITRTHCIVFHYLLVGKVCSKS